MALPTFLLVACSCFSTSGRLSPNNNVLGFTTLEHACLNSLPRLGRSTSLLLKVNSVFACPSKTTASIKIAMALLIWGLQGITIAWGRIFLQNFLAYCQVKRSSEFAINHFGQLNKHRWTMLILWHQSTMNVI